MKLKSSIFETKCYLFIREQSGLKITVPGCY